jgi:Beta-ketoacyl synthase, C-terminal domain
VHNMRPPKKKIARIKVAPSQAVVATPPHFFTPFPHVCCLCTHVCAGVFVFESLEHAQKRGAKIYGEYLGGAVTCDAHHMTDPRADGLGVSTCIQLALKDAAIDREQVNYINAHATRCVCSV